MKRRHAAFLLIAALSICRAGRAADWPTYRHDNERSGATNETVYPPLSLQWVFKPTHAPSPAWPMPAEELPRMHCDNVYHVTVAEGTAYWGTSVDDKVYAVDVARGKIRWTFFAEGPVRFAPTYHEGRLYFGSDDGNVYCLRARDGRLAWKYRAGPSDDKVIGNGRMISIWPVRTSVLVDDGQVLFAAGVWPFEGIHICALNARDGSIIWKNDTVGDRAHSLTWGGISPHGYLVASKERLYVPSGRAMPAAFDRKTGKLISYMSAGGKRGGTWAVLDDDRLIAGVEASGTPDKRAYDARTGRPKGGVFTWFPGLDMAVTPRQVYTLTRDGIYAVNRRRYARARERADLANDSQKGMTEKFSALKAELTGLLPEEAEEARNAIGRDMDEILQRVDRFATLEKRRAKESSYRWRYRKRKLSSVIVAGSVIFAGGEGAVVAVDVRTGEELWSANVGGTAHGLAAAGGRLFVSTDKGHVYCFGKGRRPEPREIAVELNAVPYGKDGLTATYESAADKVVEDSGTRKGYCLVLDCGTGRLALELAKRTELRIIGIEKDKKKLKTAREKLETAGLLGSRVVVQSWDISSLPDYFANLIVSDEMVISARGGGFSEEVLRLLRPCGGVAMSAAREGDESAWTMTVRPALEGAGSWTGLYANPQNTACSEDQLVKGPFGLLWYGEPGPQRMVERHGRPTSPVSMNGRLFVQGGDVIMAYDAYNGAFLWEREIPGAVRVRADVDGGNLALTEDALYVAARNKCHRLDPATGESVRTYDMPIDSDAPPFRRWGHVAVVGNILFGTAAVPLARDYAALWKDLVDVENGRWKNEDEIPAEARKTWIENARYAAMFEDYKTRYAIPDEDLHKLLQRRGMFWHPMVGFPSWGSQRTPENALTRSLMGGDAVFALDADTGRPLWVHRGKRIPNISITVADGAVYFVESAVSSGQKDTALEEKQRLIDKGIYEQGSESILTGPADADVRLVVALGAATGEVLWKKPLDVTGCGGDKMGAAYKDGVLLFFGHFSNHDTRFFLSGDLRWRRVTALDARTGEVLWSRPFNYLRRPLIVGDTVIIEPRACDLRTGKVKTRPHPISGKPVPWEFLRPGHCCSITSASAHALFYRSYWTAIYELTGDKGLSLFGGIRPGCWLNIIAANGLMLMPEASSGCTCSFPLRCSFALVNKPKKVTSNWTVFITHGPMTPAKRLAINLGAPGDMRDDEGTLWFGYPRPRTVSGIGYGGYGVKFDLNEKTAPDMGYFCRDYRGLDISGSDKPWLYASGCTGLLRCELPLIDDSLAQEPGLYTLRLGFTAPPGDKPGRRVFDVKVQGETLLKRFDIAREARGTNAAVIKEFNGIKVENALTVEFVPRVKEPTDAQAPIINFIQAIREDEIREAVVSAGGLSPERSREFLDAAQTEMENKRLYKALALYHKVFNEAASVKDRLRALDGMAALARPESLAHIKRRRDKAGTILTSYRADDPKVMDRTVEVTRAIIAKSPACGEEARLDDLVAFVLRALRETEAATVERFLKRGPARITIPPAPGHPTVDGKLDDAIWQGDPLIASLPRGDLSGPASAPTCIWMFWGRTSLYLAVRCTEPNLKKLSLRATERDMSVWGDDSVEVFLDMNLDRKTYYQIIVNAANVVYDGYKRSGGWDGDFVSATGREEGAWTLEMAIPWKTFRLEGPPEGKEIGLNIGRNRPQAEREFQQWAPTLRSAHRPEVFGIAEFPLPQDD